MIEALHRSAACSLYHLPEQEPSTLQSFIASTPQTRTICNDPCVVGVEYTDLLKTACTTVLKVLAAKGRLALEEREALVFHILRGGLNFGLREALAHAYGWNRHGSAFISAQRARDSHNDEDWHITESDYHKVYLPETATAVIGDVVATGTSLEHALQELLDSVDKQAAQLKSILFFTIGGPRAQEILHEVDLKCRKRFSAYTGTTLIYFEGCFAVAQPDTPMSIRVTGTDLLRRQATLAPDFYAAQYASPSYPIERCTIYDAGSRACWLPEYLHDLEEYWQQTAALADKGMSYMNLLAERFPELDAARFGEVDLKRVCEDRLARIHELKN